MRFFSVSAIVVLVCGTGACASRATTAPPSGTGASAPAQARLTPENLEALMKKIGPNYQALRTRLQANDTAEAAQAAEQLAESFGNVEKFWAQHDRNDAVKWAELARTQATEAAGAAVTGNVEKALTAAERMGGACTQCHGTYRESDGQGGYRIKSQGPLEVRPRQPR